MVTFAEQKTKAWQEMEVNSNSTTYNTDRMGDAINEIGREINEGRVYNELTSSYIEVNVLDESKGQTAFEVLESVVLQWDITVASTEILCNATNLPWAGAILIWDDIITYTSKTDTQLEGVSGILVNHYEGDTIAPVYEMPADFYKPLDLYFVRNSVEVHVEYQDSDWQLRVYYAIKKDSWKSYLYMVGNSYNYRDTYYVSYIKEYSDLIEETDISMFRYAIAKDVIPFIAGWRTIKDPDLRVKLLTQWYGKMVNEGTKAWRNISKPKKVEWVRPWFSSNR